MKLGRSDSGVVFIHLLILSTSVYGAPARCQPLYRALNSLEWELPADAHFACIVSHHLGYFLARWRYSINI